LGERAFGSFFSPGVWRITDYRRKPDSSAFTSFGTVKNAPHSSRIAFACGAGERGAPTLSFRIRSL
jgi:hypothetical protein